VSLDHRIAARCVLALLCAIQGLATPIIDFNRTHATNPNWPGHARFHLVWQAISTALLSILEVALIWWPGRFVEQRFFLAVVITCIPLLAFLIAVIGRVLYDGTLSDPNGIPPARILVLGRVRRIDLNLAVVTAALLVLAVVVIIYKV